MLSHFSVKNYKCLADVSLPLTPIHVLIGQFDTGKTSLSEAILHHLFAAEEMLGPTLLIHEPGGTVARGGSLVLWHRQECPMALTSAETWS